MLIGVQSARSFVLQELGKLNLDVQVPRLLVQQELPKLEHHFEAHGADMGCSTDQEYQDRFHAAIDKPYEEIFVTRQSRTKPVLMWRVIDQATGEVIQFSQKTGRAYSFYRAKDWPRFELETNPVRVVLTDGSWKVQP